MLVIFVPSMRRFFARNALFIVGINLLIKPVWVFAIDRTVQNRLGHADYGLYTAFLNLSIVFQIVLDFGLNSYASRRISAEPERLRDLFPSLLGARVVLMGLYATLVLGAALALGHRGPTLWLLGGTVLVQSGSVLLLFIRSNVAALHRFRLDGLLSVADRSLMILICGTLLLVPAWASRLTIGTFVIAQIVSLFAAVIGGTFLLRRLSGISLVPVLHPREVLPIIREGLPYALLIFLMSIYMRSDTVLLERMSANGAVESGIYTQSLRLLDVGNMIAIMVAGVLLPLFGRMLARGNDVAPIVRLSVNILLPLSLIGLALAVVFGQEIMQLLYDDIDDDSGLIFGTLMVAFPAYSLSYVYATLLTAAGRLRILNAISAGAVLVSLTMNFLLLPRYGAFGAAVTAAVTQVMVAVLNIIYANRQTTLESRPKWLGALGLYAVLLGGAATAAFYLPGSWLLRAAALAATGLLLMLPFHFISPGRLRALLRQ